MTRFKVVAPKAVEKQLFALPLTAIERIVARIDALAEDAWHAGGKRLKGSTNWSLRAGVYRIIYDLDEKERTIILRSIGHRKDIYR